MGISAKKKALIHVAKAKLDLSDDEYRDMLMYICGVDSSNELDMVGFNRLMRYLESVGFKTTSQFYRNMTAAQSQEIQKLERELGWNDNPRRLRGFAVKVTKREIEELNKTEAGFLIGAMRRTLRFKRKKGA